MSNLKNFIQVIFAFLVMPTHAVSKYSVATQAGVTAGGEKFDALTRTVFSKEIEYKALPIMRFLQFATRKTELGVEPGLTISMITYNNLKLGGALKELTDMTTQALSGSTKQITVSEYGNAVGVSELLIQSSFDDVMASATTLLGRDYALVMDCELRDCALSNTNVVYASESNGTPVTSRANLKEDCTLKVSTIKDAVEILATNNAPKALGGSTWICFVHPWEKMGA